MRISVVVLCFNEKDRIGPCLESLAAQDYPAADFEVLVIDNGSSDGSLALVQNHARHMNNLRLAANPQRGIAPSRNLGLKLAAHPFVAFTDADCILPQHWLSSLANGWSRHKARFPNLAAVGGTNKAPEGISNFYDAVNVVLKTPLGNRNSTQGREFGRDEPVDHIPTLNVLYHKETVLQAGGFDEDFLFVCEDPDLNYRLEAAGHVLVHLDNCCVEHVFKPGSAAWARKIFGYGQGRTQLLRKHKHKFSLLYLAPPGICGLYLLAGTTPLTGALAAVPMGAYLSCMGLYSTLQCLRKRQLKLLPRVLWLYLLTHASFGLGQVWGLWRTPAQSFHSRQARHMRRSGEVA